MNIITGYRGEPHITSWQDRAQNQGTYGTGSYILDVGRKLAAEIVSANEIRIRDGVLSHQGCIANIEQGAYDSLEIANGTQGMSRIDLIVARYTKDAETNVENIELVVIEGTAAASSPAVPSYNTGDIQAGDSPVDMPLYRVNISGVNIGSVTQVASAVRTQAETDTLLGNTSISGIGGGTLTGAVSALNSKIATGTHSSTISISANSFYDLQISFGKTFENTPAVIIIMTGSGDNAYRGNLAYTVTSTTTTGCNVRIYNSSVASLTVGIRWVAIG